MSNDYEKELAKEAGKTAVRIGTTVATATVVGSATCAAIGFVVAGPPGAVLGAREGALKGAALGGLLSIGEAVLFSKRASSMPDTLGC